MQVRPHYLDVTSVTDREEVATAFGQRAAWGAAIERIKRKEACEKDRHRKRLLRMQLLNAETQLKLHSE